MDIPYLISNDGTDIMDQDDVRFETVFVLENFEGPVFDDLKTYGNRILSESIVWQAFKTKQVFIIFIYKLSTEYQIQKTIQT